jgi:cobalt-zinc-cadmium efflux system outer membrane protein
MDAVERRLKAGDISASDVARIRVDALRAQNDARAAQADRQKAQSALGYVIGVEREAARINAADGWPDLDAAAGTPEIDKALAGRADVQAAQARVTAAEKSRDLARSLRTRDVTAQLQFDRTPWNPITNSTSANTVGFGLSVPLFLNYYYEGEIRRAEVELQSARDNYERVRALALGEIAKSRADLDAARERVQRFRESLLQAAQKAADAAEFAYSRGAIGVMDLLDARRQLYATRLEASSTQADYAKSLAAWQAAIAVVEIEPKATEKMTQ